MKKISVFTYLALGVTLIIAMIGCQSKPSLLSVDTFDETGNAQVILSSPIPDIIAEQAILGYVGKTCEYKNEKDECQGVKLLVLGRGLSVDQVVPSKLIGTLIIEIDKESKTLIVGIPFDKEMRELDPRNFMEFFVDHEDVKRSIENWFLSFYGSDAQLLGWDNDSYGRDHIKRHLYENL